MGKTCRSNPRAVYKLIDEDLSDYMLGMGHKVLNLKTWLECVDYMERCPYGMNEDERRVLASLYSHDSCPLGTIASDTSLPSKAISDVHEQYLKRLGFMRVDGKRFITPLGRKIVKELGLTV